MQTSVFLAQLIGPVILVSAVSLFLNGDGHRAMARDFLESTPLIYVSGVLLMTAGVAIVLYHNVWVLNWRVIITLFGWLAVIGGAFRILFFRKVEQMGEAMLDKPWGLPAGGAIWLIFGIVLCFFGYVD